MTAMMGMEMSLTTMRMAATTLRTTKRREDRTSRFVQTTKKSLRGQRQYQEEKKASFEIENYWCCMMLMLVLLVCCPAALASFLLGSGANATVLMYDLDSQQLSALPFAAPVDAWMSNVVAVSDLFGAIGVRNGSFVWVTFSLSKVAKVHGLASLAQHLTPDPVLSGFGVKVGVIGQRVVLWVFDEVQHYPGNSTLFEMLDGPNITLKQLYTLGPDATPYCSFMVGGSLAIGTSQVPVGDEGDFGIEFSIYNMTSGVTQSSIQTNDFPFGMGDPTQYYLANSSGSIFWLAPSTVESKTRDPSSFHSVLYNLQCSDMDFFMCSAFEIAFIDSPAFPWGSCSAVHDSELLTFVCPVTLHMVDTPPTNVSFARISLADGSVKRSSPKLSAEQIQMLETVIGACLFVEA